MNHSHAEFNGKTYAFDLEKIIKFCSSLTNNEKNSETTITHLYSDNQNDDPGNILKKMPISQIDNLEISVCEPTSKEIREIKANCNDNFNSIRYDLVRGIILPLLKTNYDKDGLPIIPEYESDFTFEQKICFNTLLKYGMLTEINCEN